MTVEKRSATTSDEQPADDGLSRRGMLLGLGALAGAGAAVSGLAGWAGAAAPAVYAPTADAEALDPPIPGLTYLNIDAQAFWPTFGMGPGDPPGSGRLYEDITGSKPQTTANRLWAPLPLPVGSVIHVVSAAYQNQPIIEISRRPLFNTGAPGSAPTQDFQLTFPASPGGAFAHSATLAPPVTIAADATYTVSMFSSGGASIFGVSIGYVPPTQSFIPFTGGAPRALDTRSPGQTKFAAGEQRKVNLGLAGARSAVFNLTVDETEGNVAGSPPGGFLSAFAGDAFPGNSSVNWDHPGQIVANLVISALDTAGNVTIRCNINRAHVILDRIGFLI